jgi:hypothetical protein
LYLSPALIPEGNLYNLENQLILVG